MRDNAANLLAEMGMKVIAVSDSKGAIHNRDGINVDSLRSHKLKKVQSRISKVPVR